MALADEVAAEHRGSGKRRTMFEQVCDALGDEAPELLALLDDPDVKGAAIHRALVNRGFQVSDATVQSWKRGESRGARG